MLSLSFCKTFSDFKITLVPNVATHNAGFAGLKNLSLAGYFFPPSPPHVLMVPYEYKSKSNLHYKISYQMWRGQ